MNTEKGGKKEGRKKEGKKTFSVVCFRSGRKRQQAASGAGRGKEADSFSGRTFAAVPRGNSAFQHGSPYAGIFLYSGTGFPTGAG